MIRTISAAAVATVAVLALAGCSSSGGGSGGSSPAATGALAGSQLASKIEQGTAGLTSAHLDIDAGALGGTISGVVSLAKGQTTGSQLTMTQSGDTIEVITVGGTSYAKLPTTHNTSGKPWVKVSTSSSNEFVRGLAGSMTLANAATSLGSVGALLDKAATSIHDMGSVQLDGVRTEHYALTIDPSKASGDLGSALGTTGSKAVPVDLWLDGKNRPVQVKISVPLGQQALPLLVKISDFNTPVHIAAPPAEEVSTS